MRTILLEFKRKTPGQVNRPLPREGKSEREEEKTCLRAATWWSADRESFRGEDGGVQCVPGICLDHTQHLKEKGRRT